MLSINEGAVKKKTKMATKFGLTVFNGQNCYFMCTKEHHAARFPFFVVCICCSIIMNKSNFGLADYSVCVVYNKTIIQLSVGESTKYLPPLHLILVNY